MGIKSVIAGITGALGLAGSVLAHERVFTYTYEPATPPKGELEFEQHVTSRLGRNSSVGQTAFHRLQLSEEIEYGVTDNYQVSLYFNHQYEHFHDPATGQRTSNYRQQGFSLENKYQVLNPTEHAIGLALYLEPTYNGTDFELEQKLILGQRHGAWRWALNLTHATEWQNHFRGEEGEVEASFGIARQVSSRWSLGFEVRDHNEIPEYARWENTAVYLGPVLGYKRRGWFATLSVMPQIYGANYIGNPDNNPHLDLEGHERLNVRLICGFDF